MFYMYVGLCFIYCFPVEGCSLAAESSILINYLVRERLYSFITIFCTIFGAVITVMSSCSCNRYNLQKGDLSMTRNVTQNVQIKSFINKSR